MSAPRGPDRILSDKIAAIIREADGDHTMGAGALGDAIAYGLDDSDLLDVLVRAGYLPRAKELADLAAEFARHNGCSSRDALDLLVAAMEAQR